MTSDHPTPHLPLVGRDHLVARLVDDAGRSGWSGALLAGPVGVGRSRLLAEVATALGAPLVVVRPGGALGLPDQGELVCLDGLERLDGRGAIAVHAAVTSGRTRVLGTLATGPLGPPTPDLVATLWREGVLDRHDLAPLTRGEVAEVAEQVLGGPLEGVSATQLWSRTDGLPASLATVLTAADRTLARTDGTWHLREREPHRHGEAGPDHDLDLDEQTCLELLAVTGGLSLDALLALVDEPTAEALEVRGLMEVVDEDGPGGHWARATPLAQPDAVAAGVGSTRRVELRAGLARATGWDRPVGEAPLPPAWAADWLAFEAPDDHPWRVRGLLAAAQQATDDRHRNEAARWAAAAVEAGAGSPANHLLANALDDLGLNDEAATAGRAAVHQATTDEDRGRAAMRLSQILARSEPDGTSALAVLDEVAARVTDPWWAGALAVQRGSILVHLARLDEAVAVVEPIVELTEATVAEAVVVLGPALAVSGRPLDAVAVAERGLAALAADGTVPALEVNDQELLDVVRAMGHLEAGALDRAEAAAQTGYRRAVVREDRWSQGWFCLCLARTAGLRGTMAASLRWWSECAFAFGTVDQPGYRSWALAGRAEALAVTGDLDGAAAVAAEFHAVPPHDVRIYQPDAARAAVAATDGDADATRAVLADAQDEARSSGQVACELAVLVDLARLGATVPEDLARATELAAGAQGDLVPARARLVIALGTPGEEAIPALTAVAIELHQLGCGLLAAEAWAAAALVDPSRRAALGAARRAAAIRSGLGPVRTELLDRLDQLGPIEISDREREVADLAAAGRSRAEIASACFLSLRTVDRHLNEAYAKLGVTERGELAEALTELDQIHAVR